jgi:hypothetical protein
MVCIYAIITSKLNQKAKCDHDWEENANGVARCRKCNKSFQSHGAYDNEHMAAWKFIFNKKVWAF